MRVPGAWQVAVKGWRTALSGAAHADRMLLLALLAGVMLGAVLLWSHASERIRAFETALNGQIRTRAGSLDVQMRVAVGHLEALRQRAEFFYAEYPAPEDVPNSNLLMAFLGSNPRGDARQGYSLDRLPPPYLVDQIGNIVALPAIDVSANPVLSRPDEAGWRQEAAMAVQLLPLLAVTQKVVPEARRLVYASLSGMLAIHPWVESRQADLLPQVGTLPAFINAAPSANPIGGPVWTLSGREGDFPDSAMLALPLTLQGRYAGALGIDIPVAGLRDVLGAVQRVDSILLLVDQAGNVITGSSRNQEKPLPRTVAEILPPGTSMETGPDGMISHGFFNSHIVAIPLKQAPWRVVYAAAPGASLLPILMDMLISVAGFVAAVLVVVFVARRLMLRALAVRDDAAVAEREARAEAERALTDLRAAHDELDFLNREKTRFFSLISHDLRGPFNSMLGMTQELADHAPKMKPEDVADFARTVHEMARKVFELLENLLQWSRVQMSGTPFAPTIFPMREVVSDAIRDVASAAQGKEITILDAAGDRWVLADRTMILAVLRNLLMNAVKFSHQGGVVHVTSRALGDRLEVAVTDKGVGMEPAQLDLALKGGPKASRPGTQGETGTGLGLTLVRDLVLRHGGELKLESTPGRGTIASFTVPLSTDPAETRRLMQRAAD